MSLTKRVARNTLIQIAGKVVSTLLGLFSIVLITRYLGRNGFGEYTTIITFLTFFAVAADFGLTLVTAQMISGKQAAEEKIINNLFGLRLVSALAFIILAPLTIIFFPYPGAIKVGVMIAAASFLFPALNQVIIGLFQRKLSMGHDAIAEAVSRIALIAGIMIVWRWDRGLNGILWATVVAAAVNFAYHYLAARKFLTIRPEFDREIWQDIFRRSWPLAVTIVLNLIYLRADTLLLSLYHDAGEVGLYGATYRIIDVLTSFPFMFAGLILPILTASWLEGNKEYFRHVLQKSFDFMAIGAIPLIIGAQFLSGPIMRYTGGPDFAAAGPILQILMFAVAAIFLGTIFSHAIISIDKQKKMIGFYALTSASALGAYLLVIPRWSYFGAALVTIYSEVMIAAFSVYCVYRYSRFLPRLAVGAKSLISGLVMGAFLYFSQPISHGSLAGLLTVFLAAGAVYCLVLLLIGGVRRSDLDRLFRHQDKPGGPSVTPESKPL